ncbi:hypothetical protein [Thermoactinospora rubra]|uniref:hypothetical protein n=1 Tax=Thermoactinospora rubra TaxID=1088767 RepID=UPI00117C89AE|nr:hypothetical protein [Thermoactinospora rubra]
MTKAVLLVGRKAVVVEDAQRRLDLPGVRVLSATGVEEVRRAFAAGPVDHVVMGAGLDLATRLEIVRVVFESSDATTVHMKDSATGPEGFLPFARSILKGLSGLSTAHIAAPPGH